MTDVPPLVYRFSVVVEVDAVTHGFDLSRADAKAVVESAIDAAEGLRVLVEKPQIEVGQTWELTGCRMVVQKVGRKYAHVVVFQPGGGSWEKKQPMPFPESAVLLDVSHPCEVPQ